MEILPPLSYLTPSNTNLTVSRAGIFKCNASGIASVGILWRNNNNNKYFFEFVHGYVGKETDVKRIVEICRTRCVGTFVYCKDFNLWNHYVNRRHNLQSLFLKDFTVC